MQGDLFRGYSGMGLREREAVARLKYEYHQWRRSFVGPPCPDLGLLMLRPQPTPPAKPPIRRRVRLSPAEVQRRVTAAGLGLIMVGEYIGSKELTDFTCANGHSFQIRPSEAIKGIGCRLCRCAKPLETAEVVRRLAQHGKGIELIGPYVNNTTITRFRCSQGHEFEVRASVPISGCGCKVCHMSKRKNGKFTKV